MNPNGISNNIDNNVSFSFMLDPIANIKQRVAKNAVIITIDKQTNLKKSLIKLCIYSSNVLKNDPVILRVTVDFS